MASAYASLSAAKAAGAEAQGQVLEKECIEVPGGSCRRAGNPAWFTFLTLFRVSTPLGLPQDETASYLHFHMKAARWCR